MRRDIGHPRISQRLRSICRAEDVEGEEAAIVALRVCYQDGGPEDELQADGKGALPAGLQLSEMMGLATVPTMAKA
ncbi:hypothetical protein PZA11_007460 [Diplocarpon coronariae]